MKEMTLPELEEADRGLRLMPERLEHLSGICGVLSGLVLHEIKERLPHKHFGPWLENNYGKTSRTARRCMQIGLAFSKTDTVSVLDKQLTLSLFDDARSQSLDLAHPVVQSVVKWTDGRSFRRLIEEEALDGRGDNKGGNRHPKCPHCGKNLKTKKQEVCPHCKKETGAKVDPDHDPKQAEAIDLWTPILRDAWLEIESKSAAHLPDKGKVSREALKALHLGLGEHLRAMERKGK